MDFIRENFPNVAYFIPDGINLNSRIPIKCRILDEEGQFFQVNLSGLIDVGTSATISTPTKLDMGKNSKIILNDVLYSIKSIIPYLPDPSIQGLIKKKVGSEYIIQLG